MIVTAAAGDARRALGLYENIAAVYDTVTEETVRDFLAGGDGNGRFRQGW